MKVCRLFKTFITLFIFLCIPFSLAYGKEAKNFYIDPIFEGEPIFTGMEVYVEKDGKFFALYQTMDYSDYRYSTHLEKGTYTFQCRVMYNTKAQYKVEPKSITLVIDDNNYSKENKLQFTVINREWDPEGLEETEPIPPDPDIETLPDPSEWSNEQLESYFALSDEDKNKVLESQSQEFWIEESIWEKKNSFITKYNIEPGTNLLGETGDGDMHWNPDDIGEDGLPKSLTSDANVTENEIKQIEDEPKSTDSLEYMESSENTSTSHPETSKNIKVKDTKSSNNIAFVLGVALIVFLGIGYFVIKGRKNNHGEES